MDALRAGALEPRFWTDAPRSVTGRGELLRGAELLRFSGPRAKAGYRIRGHQVLLSDILDAPHRYLPLLMPRRSFKTSTIFSKAIGRIAERPDYMVAYTMATTGLKARARFAQDIVKPLEMLYPNKATRPFRIVKAGGAERIEWIETGSTFAFLTPTGDAFRSDAWDWIIIDEAGSADVEMSDDLMAGAVATQDDRPGAHFTITGTAPKFRKGNLLWDMLERGRAAEKGISILEYSVEQTTTIDDLLTDGERDWEKARPLVLRAHPNIGETTDIEVMESNFLVGIQPADFLTDYLGVAGTVGSEAYLDLQSWATAGTDDPLPQPPERFAMAMQVHPFGESASIGVAWRDEQGRACVGLVDRRDSVTWLRDRVLQMARKHGVEVVHDSMGGAVLDQVELLQRARPRPKLSPQKTTDVTTAAVLFKRELDSGNLRHWNQPDLTSAVTAARKRQVGNGSSWAFGRPPSGDDITGLEAVAAALHKFDTAPAQTRLRAVGKPRAA